VEASVSRGTLLAGETGKWSRVLASFSPSRLTEGDDSLTVTRATSNPRTPALGRTNPAITRPARIKACA